MRLQIIYLGNINIQLHYRRSKVIAKKITILESKILKEKKERDRKDLFSKIPIWSTYIIIIPPLNEDSFYIGQPISIENIWSHNLNIWIRILVVYVYDVWLNKKGCSIEWFPLPLILFNDWPKENDSIIYIEIRNGMNLDQPNNDISMQRFGWINLSISIVSIPCGVMIKKGRERKIYKNGIHKKWGSVPTGMVQQGICNLMVLSQLLWMFRGMILESDWI